MLEYIGVFLSATGVFFTTRRSLWNGPFAMLACLVYGWIFFNAKLYADMVLQGIFFTSTIYTWYSWIGQYKKQKREQQDTTYLVLEPLTLPALIIGMLFIIIGTNLWGWSLYKWTDDPAPFIDAGLSCSSLLAQYWTAKRYRANWLLWIVIDTLYCGLFINRALYPTSALFAGFVLLSIYGYIEWGRRAKNKI
ncbi:nicotinamide riboside transporter PnuC [Aristophania vespae]|uniref:Nicotinamide riboside transporter PnuC n=1 Tax=Aristophania vespae TaxID=2697033 RepID=A0A6P1NBZ6_9PROT|nr:nicotinamide riboside transporter PnuC [Aristophania vespae]QHI95033.1 nicotinamide riboside transporter PnuC [Aristophania vespae]